MSLTARDGNVEAPATESVRAGSLDELRTAGRLLTKVGSLPVVVVWHEGRAYAVEDRCPHMGFPLHQGTVEAGLLTCHWHHARFDLASGCTLDLWADDARGFDVTVAGDDVFVAARPVHDPLLHLRRRLRDGLENDLALVTAKAVLGLLEAGVPASEVVRIGLEFGTRYRGEGWGTGATALVAMANVLPHLDGKDHVLALVHGLARVAADTGGHAPRFGLDPLGADGEGEERLASWYRRFIDTRSPQAAERVLATAIVTSPEAAVEAMMFAAATDHVFLDGGHTLDFTNKAFEALQLVGADAAADVLPTLVRGTAAAMREEEAGEWRHPHDLAGLAARIVAGLDAKLAEGAGHGSFDDVAALGWRLLAEEPGPVVEALDDAISGGATPEQLGRALAFAAALRIVRFHTQNDFGDWDTVHHAFTAANALHQALKRVPTPELVRGVVHGALKVYLDRFLNVPAARLPHVDLDGPATSLADLPECWDAQGGVDRAGTIVYTHLRTGGDPAAAVAALGHALLREDAGFHWYQMFEASVRQLHEWPPGSEEGALVLAAFARFLAAHTPTRRELARVVDIATRLRRGEELYETVSG